MSWEVREGQALDALPELEPDSVHTCVTSPPYWGLRDYGTEATVWDGDPECEHEFGAELEHGRRGNRGVSGSGGGKFHPALDEAGQAGGAGGGGVFCRCGAWLGSLGLEPTPDLYIQHLVQIMDQVRRALRPDGSLWLNLGDCYNSIGGTVGGKKYADGYGQRQRQADRKGIDPDLKPKDLVGIPWRVAFALQADGWWLRSDIIWSKPNPMPESVRDRPTRSHEYIFLLTKSERYFYDAEAIKEDFADDRMGNPGAHDRTSARAKGATEERQDLGFINNGGGWNADGTVRGRNRRDVWEIASQPFPGAHFATFPLKLVEPCILAGSPPSCCTECGAPRERQVRQETRYEGNSSRAGRTPEEIAASGKWSGENLEGNAGLKAGPVVDTETIGWAATCDHGSDDAAAKVLDPFCGSGTTGLVALRHNRSFVGIELSEKYAAMARDRIRDDAPLFNYSQEVA